MHENTKTTNISESTNNRNYWQKIKKKKPKKKLFFIHTPKCGGKYAGQILKKLKIRNKNHNRATTKDVRNNITFTIIRCPIQRFESLMNYRLNENKPREDWPLSLAYVFNDKSICLNKIVKKMSNKDIMNFSPYKSLLYWSTNIDIFITINKLQEFLSFFGYKYNSEDFRKLNVSKKERGKFNKLTKKRISKLYRNDVILFKKKI